MLQATSTLEKVQNISKWTQDIQHNDDTQNNDSQHNDTQHMTTLYKQHFAYHSTRLVITLDMVAFSRAIF